MKVTVNVSGGPPRVLEGTSTSKGPVTSWPAAVASGSTAVATWSAPAKTSFNAPPPDEILPPPPATPPLPLGTVHVWPAPPLPVLTFGIFAYCLLDV